MAWYGLVWWDAWGTMVKHIHFLKQCFWFSLLWPTCQDFLIPLRHLSKIQWRIVFFCPCALKWLFPENARSLLETHWSVVYLPLWKIWVRQLGSLFTIYGKMFQTTNQHGTVYTYEKYEFVNWDHCSQYMEKMFQTTNQHGTVCRTVPHVGQSQPSWDCCMEVRFLQMWKQGTQRKGGLKFIVKKKK